eukprot:scaffold272266_cov30-Tisochrysis_lutea.AAC.1
MLLGITDSDATYDLLLHQSGDILLINDTTVYAANVELRLLELDRGSRRRQVGLHVTRPGGATF